MSTPYHSLYWATLLTLRAPVGSIDRLSQSLATARVDLNPHQVDAALFAIHSPLSKGVILADGVGLGKTIEATQQDIRIWYKSGSVDHPCQGENWGYLLIPHDQVRLSMTFAGFIAGCRIEDAQTLTSASGSR